MFEYICKNCGEVKYAQYNSWKRIFCSHKCANEYKCKNTPKKRANLICKTCGKTFYVFPGDVRVKNKTIKYCSKKCAFDAMKKGKIVECLHCGKPFYSTRNTFCSPKCASDYKSEHAEHKPWDENGYLVVQERGYNKKGNAKQHRLIIEHVLGRRLDLDEVVHHINGDKKDNRIENLCVMSRKEHSKLHRELEKSTRLHNQAQINVIHTKN